MASVNKVILIGNLTKDPEVRYTPSGAAVCAVGLATNRTWKNKEGEKQEEVEFHRVTFYDRLAEIAGEYAKKGKPIYVEGRLKTRKWEKDGHTNYTTEIIVENLQLLGGREDSAPAAYRPAARTTAPAARTGAAPARKPAPSTGTGFYDMLDDIPF